MKDTVCVCEERVRAGLAQGGLDPELRDHSASCPVCREAAAVSSWLQQFRAATLREYAPGARIPSAPDILERARRQRVSGRIDASDILKPLRAYRRIVLPAGLGAGIAAAILNASSIKGLLLSLPGLRSSTSGPASGSAFWDLTPAGLLAIPAGLGLLTILALIAATRVKRAER